MRESHSMSCITSAIFWSILTKLFKYGTIKVGKKIEMSEMNMNIFQKQRTLKVHSKFQIIIFMLLLYILFIPKVFFIYYVTCSKSLFSPKKYKKVFFVCWKYRKSRKQNLISREICEICPTLFSSVLQLNCAKRKSVFILILFAG